MGSLFHKVDKIITGYVSSILTLGKQATFQMVVWGLFKGVLKAALGIFISTISQHKTFCSFCSFMDLIYGCQSNKLNLFQLSSQKYAGFTALHVPKS